MPKADHKMARREGGITISVAGWVDRAGGAEIIKRQPALDLLVDQQTSYNALQHGHTLPVLCDRKARFDGQINGRSPYRQSVYVDATDHLIGQIVPVKIRQPLSSLTLHLVN